MFSFRPDIVVEINISSGKYKCKFQNAWLTDERFRAWIRKAENDPDATFCSFWQKSGQGITQLESHMKGEKQKQKTPPNPAASKQKTLMIASTSDPTGGTTTEKDNKKREHTLDTAIISKDTVKAEIMS